MELGHTSKAAASPDIKKAILVSLGIKVTSGIESKKGTMKARRRTDIGAWLRSN